MTSLNCANSDAEFDSCEPLSWYGTYDKISEDCDNGGTPLFDNTIFFKEGSCDLCLSEMSSVEYMIDEDCKVVHITPLGWELVMELNGDMLSVELISFDCKATFNRQE